LLAKNTRKLDVGYEVPITWRVDVAWSLLRRFDRDPDFEKDYRAAITKKDV
jgi:hypothetical protein